jgi:hypothetical protein
MTITNQQKAELFHQWLGGRFKTFEVASDNAPISFLAKDNEDKEYYVHVEIAKELSVKDREMTGIKITNTHFYHLYAMASQGQNMFWFEAFPDGYMLFYINDCLTPEQLKVTDEFTMIGVTSALHIEKPAVKVAGNDDKTYYVTKAPEPKIIPGSFDINKTKVNKRKR